MATKRPAPSVHPSRHEQVPDEPRRKRQKPDNLGTKSFKKAHPTNDLKSQIRSLKRLLEHNDDLPANVRVEKERALQSAQRELEQTQRAKQKSDMIGKYHKVRFFDRQKATKRLKRAKKELAECIPGEKVEVQRRVEEAEVDVNYAIYYPLDKAYRALFPSKQKEDEKTGEPVMETKPTDTEREGDPEMLQRVKQCMADGTLDALRNGKLTAAEESVAKQSEVPTDATTTKRKRTKGKDVGVGDPHGNRRERRSAAAAAAAARAESDAESDGGFFE